MKVFLILFSLTLLSSLDLTQSSFAWDGQMAMDSDKRNVEYGDVINYKGYLYGASLIDGEIVNVVVSEQDTENIIWNVTIIPSSTTVDYFENTARTFEFQLNTLNSEFAKDTTYVVKASYDDQTTYLDFFTNSNKLEEKATEAGNAIIVAGEKTGEVIVETGTQAGEVIVETGTQAGEVIVETGTQAGEVIVEKSNEAGQAIVETGEKTREVIVETGNEVAEKGAIIGEVAVEKSSEGIQEINEKGGGCLIANAAYGTEMAPQVQFLREIRDNTVLSTSSGAAFMTGFNQLYYSFSPTIADMERENPMFQEAVRAFITPMVSTLSIMTLAEDGSEIEVLGLGLSVIALNLGMYIAAPALIGFKVHRHIKSKK